MIIQYMGLLYICFSDPSGSRKKKEIVMVLKADTSDLFTLVFYFVVNHEWRSKIQIWNWMSASSLFNIMWFWKNIKLNWILFLNVFLLKKILNWYFLALLDVKNKKIKSIYFNIYFLKLFYKIQCTIILNTGIN
jgi:hypothetical protein